MYLEALAEGQRAQRPRAPVARDGGLWRIDWGPLVPWLTRGHLAPEEVASGFHEGLARALVARPSPSGRRRASSGSGCAVGCSRIAG